MSEQSEPRPLAPAPQPVSEPWRVTWRSILIGLVLVPFNVYWVIAAELRYYLILTLNPLFVTPIAWLFGLVMLNLLVHRFFPKLALKTSELVVIYVMLVMSCTIATHDYIINLVSEIGWLRWFASPENQWESLIFGHLPKWLLVWDKDALKGYFQGGSSLLEEEAWRVWVRPLAFWSLFIFASCWIMMCLSTILTEGLDRRPEALLPHCAPAPGADLGRARRASLQEPPALDWLRGGLWALFTQRVAWHLSRCAGHPDPRKTNPV